MADITELYQSLILDHKRSPRNHGAPAVVDRVADGRNPMCGDQLRVWVTLDDDGRVTDVRFAGKGCAISQASASLMTVAVKGKTRAEAEAMFERFHDLVTGKLSLSPTEARAMGEMAAFSGVSKFPIRVKCASMPWHTLRKALGEGGDAPSTHE